jgi:hypothetical protein
MSWSEAATAMVPRNSNIALERTIDSDMITKVLLAFHQRQLAQPTRPYNFNFELDAARAEALLLLSQKVLRIVLGDG